MSNESTKTFDSGHDIGINAVHSKRRFLSKGGKSKQSGKMKSGAGDSGKCFRCGSVNHKANYDKCPAVKERCRLCNKVGHFSSVCFAKGRSEKVNYLEPDCDDYTEYVLTVSGSKREIPCPRCNITVQNILVNFLVDSGSPYTFIPEALYDTLFGHITLCEKDITPGGYGGTPINITGYFKSNLQ
jgi:hypothetical protein